MARVLTLDLSWLSPLLIFLGVIFFLSRKQTRAGQLGRVGIGLGLIILALQFDRRSRRADYPRAGREGAVRLTDRRHPARCAGRRVVAR